MSMSWRISETKCQDSLETTMIIDFEATRALSTMIAIPEAMHRKKVHISLSAIDPSSFPSQANPTFCVTDWTCQVLQFLTLPCQTAGALKLLAWTCFRNNMTLIPMTNWQTIGQSVFPSVPCPWKQLRPDDPICQLHKWARCKWGQALGCRLNSACRGNPEFWNDLTWRFGICHIQNLGLSISSSLQVIHQLIRCCCFFVRFSKSSWPRETSDFDRVGAPELNERG